MEISIYEEAKSLLNQINLLLVESSVTLVPAAARR